MADPEQTKAAGVPDGVADGGGEMVWPTTDAPAPEPEASVLPREEPSAIVVYVARNLLNTVDTRPAGYAWFSA